MITVTWRDIIDELAPRLDSTILQRYHYSQDLPLGQRDNIQLLAEFRVYAIKDETGVVVYVGQSRSALEGLLGHIGLGDFSWAQLPSPPGEYVVKNLTASLSWEIDLYALEDCYLTFEQPMINIVTSAARWVDELKDKLIFEFSPWFNSTGAKSREPVRPTPYDKTLPTDNFGERLSELFAF